MAFDAKDLIKDYNTGDLTIGVLGGHSGLDICRGAKKLGFRTVAVCEKGRERTYSEFYKTRKVGDREIGCVDEVIVVDKFADVVNPAVQEKLRALNTIFIHNRYFWVYCDFKAIESDFNVPIFGTRELVKLEERDVDKNQYWLLEQAGIRTPRIIRAGGEKLTEPQLRNRLDEHFTAGDRPLIIKAHEAARGYERAFFVITNTDDYFSLAEEVIADGTVDEADFETSTIEEFILGTQVNFNFFYSPLTKQLELMGTDMRRQTNLDGFLRLDAGTQLGLLQKGVRPTMIETGHVACTIKESLVEKALMIGEQFVATTQEHTAPGIIGPFALQGAVDSATGREELVIFDVSMRIPGSPGTMFTPYSGYLYGESMSYGERVAMEIAVARDAGKLEQLLT